METLIKYIENEVKRLGFIGYELAPWNIVPKDAAGTVSNVAVPTQIGAGQLVIVTNAIYVVEVATPQILNALDNSLLLKGNPGYAIQPLQALSNIINGANNYVTLGWQGISPAFYNTIKPEFAFLGGTLKTARLEGWSIVLNK